MPIRVVVVGDDSMSLCTQMASLARSMNFAIVGMAGDAATARVTMAQERPDVAVIASTLRDGTGFDLVASLTPHECPAAVVFCSPREEDAVRAFELRATDFVTLPVRAERLADALLRARRQALQMAMQRTADELERLLAVAPAAMAVPEHALSRAAVAAVDAERRAASGAVISVDAERPAGLGAVISLEADRQVASSPVGAGAWTSGRAYAGGASADAEPWRRSVAEVREDREDVCDVGLALEDVNAAGLAVLGAVLDVDVSSSVEPDAPFDGLNDREARPLRVLVREGRRTRFVSLQDVDWFEADGNYVLVRTAGESYRTRGTMSAIERVLDPMQFVRIHRRVVVNMDRVRELTPLPGGDGMLTLGDGSTLRLSRTYRSRVR